MRKSDPSLFYLQRLRDEAHRFAIGTHRQKRDKSIHFNPLDEIPGIGSKRKKEFFYISVSIVAPIILHAVYDYFLYLDFVNML